MVSDHSTGETPAPSSPAHGTLTTEFVPRVDTRRFRHELTPTWLATAALLAGFDLPVLHRPFRAVWLGCTAPFTPLVAAAVHPDSAVLAWDPSPITVASIRQHRDAAALDNLAVHEHPDPPAGSRASEPHADLVVIDGLLDATAGDRRQQVVESAATAVRPGGVVAVTYRTVVGWAEIAPVVRILRHMALSDQRPLVQSVADVKVLLKGLDERQIGYVHERRAVKAWLAELLSTDPVEVVEQYVTRDLQPVSHAQVTEAFAGHGLSYLGSARPGRDLSDDLSGSLLRQVQNTASPLLRETLADLALRRSERVDLFGLGSVLEVPRTRTTRIRNLRVATFAPPPGPLTTEVLGLDAATVEGLHRYPVSVKDLWPGAKPPERERLLRRAMAAGVVHPTADSAPTPEAIDASERLTDQFTHSRIPIGDRCLVAPGLGSAVPADRPPDAARLAVIQGTIR